MRVIERKKLDWAFGRETPTLQAGFPINVDPFPCYAHDIDDIKAEAAKVVNRMPIENTPTIYNLHYEATTRTNGWAQRDWDWPSRKEGERTWTGAIGLNGKRIVLHPAMTRYLVSHEYGHHVEWEIERVRGWEPDHDLLRKEYMKLRGGSLDYGARNWHNNVGELFANDFRILVCDTETDFWPHKGFEHPFDNLDAQNWWSDAIKEVAP